MQPHNPPPPPHPSIPPPQTNLPILLNIQIVRPLLLHQKRRLQFPEVAHHILDGIIQDGQGRDLRSFSLRIPFRSSLFDGVFEVGAFAVEFGAEVIEGLRGLARGGVHCLEGGPEDAEEGDEGDDEGDEADDYAGVGDGGETACCHFSTGV